MIAYRFRNGFTIEQEAVAERPGVYVAGEIELEAFRRGMEVEPKRGCREPSSPSFRSSAAITSAETSWEKSSLVRW